MTLSHGTKTRAVLFDLDGTLLDTTQLIIESFEYTARTCLGRPMTEAEVLPRLGEPLVVTMGELCPDRVDELINAYRQFNLAEHDRLVRLVPGVPDTLQALKNRGLRLAVVSSKVRHTVCKGLDLFRLTPFFDVIIGLEDCPAHKPDPGPLLEALRRMEVEPADAVMVGDSPADILAARAAKVKGVAVGWSRLAPETMAAAAPDATISTMPELLDVIGLSN
ncbi:MAG: pyrophosphatase PpaX [Bacillota bacterium]